MKETRAHHNIPSLQLQIIHVDIILWQNASASYDASGFKVGFLLYRGCAEGGFGVLDFDE